MKYKDFKQTMLHDYGLATELSLNGDITLTGQVQDGLGGEVPILTYNAKKDMIFLGDQNDMADTEYTIKDAEEVKPLFRKFVDSPNDKKEYPKYFTWWHKFFH